MSLSGFLHKDSITAPLHYNRWLIPPAALAIHLCIGQIYAYSVFSDPMTRLIGGAKPGPEDWTVPSIGWIYSIALFCLGASAALFGKWVERSGPRKTMFVSALCFCGGFLISAAGVHLHQLWLLYLGNGLLGGIGLGLGYISPVSTLMKWFPDKPGMATGLAIMGFGGGALVASPLSGQLMEWFRTDNSPGVMETLLALGGIYFCFMMFAMYIVRVPAPGWNPPGFDPQKQTAQHKALLSRGVVADVAIRTPQFWLLFGVLLLNVTAGIGILGQAEVMIRDIFSSESVGVNYVSRNAAIGFVGFLSLFNMGGRFLWSSFSDFIGRKNVYAIFFLLGATLYALLPFISSSGSTGLFVAVCAVLITLYGGGFATIPAYLRDLFGVIQVGAIHGRLLLAWSIAAVAGPSIVNYMREFRIQAGVPPSEAYHFTFFLLAGLLVIGFILNAFVKPVDPKYHHQPKEEYGNT